jgi:hypothetical protein
LPRKTKQQKKSMRLSRRSRFITALIALMSVLFTQLAVAAYECPRTQIAQAMESIAAPGAAAEHHEMPGCGGIGAEESSLCQDHGQGGNQSLDKPELPHVSPFITALLVQAVSHDDLAYPSTTPASTSLSLTRTTAPPLAIQNCCFRI